MCGSGRPASSPRGPGPRWASVAEPSADLPKAAEVAAFARLLNNGQSCIAAKRFIVHDAVYDEFERLFTAQMSAKTVGDPMKDGTDVGPLASEQQRDDVE
ncbi:MAG TPA: aldehyde dehydrogenase family protein, partial [Streptosporangiaceae bacterium]|nr:aldehyde dehydrogenase family protein [Streptosporangiaceae bacterium]